MPEEPTEEHLEMVRANQAAWTTHRRMFSQRFHIALMEMEVENPKAVAVALSFVAMDTVGYGHAAIDAHTPHGMLHD